MSQMVGRDDIESLRIELEEIGRSFNLGHHFRVVTPVSEALQHRVLQKMTLADAQYAAQSADIERLPTSERLKSFLFDNDDDGDGKRVVDVTKLGALEKHVFIDRLIKHIENDNLCFLRKIRNRIDKLGVKLPTVEVSYKNLSLQKQCVKWFMETPSQLSGILSKAHCLEVERIH